MALAPMMKHYLQTKENYKDCIVFYRLGDFYEMFFEDAILASKLLELTLTGRDCGLETRAPMCGIPVKCLYLDIGPCRCNQVKIKSLRWALVHYD